MSPEADLDGKKTEQDGAERPEESFARAFMRLIQMARLHRAQNRLVLEMAGEFIRAGRKLLEDDSFIAVETRHSRLFVQGQRILFKKQNAVFILSLLSYFERLGIYGFEFNAQFAEITKEQACHFVQEILEALQSTYPLELLDQRLDTEAHEWAGIIYTLRQSHSEISSEEKAEIVHQLYSTSYNAVQEVSEKLMNNQTAGVRKPLRVVQDIADLAFVDKSILMGSMTIRDYDDYTFTHSVNVAIQTICLGHELGLSRHSLVRLGICGLFHDLGKVDIPQEIINKPGPLTASEFRTVKHHSLNSVRRMIRLEASPDLLAGIILPPFEHHLRYDLQGYPEVGWKAKVSFFGRIVQICDVYDALTSSRVYRSNPLSPDRAIGMMLRDSGKAFDPVLLKWFVNMHGVLPVGTVVGLNTGELGVVCDGGDLREKRHPRFVILQEAEDGYQRKEVIDLNQSSTQNGRESPKIRSTHHPGEFGIQPFVHLAGV